MKLLPILFSLALAGLIPQAQAQWMWLDKDGRKVFSDRAPPADVPDKAILRRPGGVAPPPAAASVSPPSSPSPASNKPATAKAGPLDKEVEERKKQADAAEADKRKAEEAKIAQEKAENCNRARQAKATIDSGMRIARVNEQGERIILEDAERNAELARAQGIIDSDCR